jgi:transcription-repair coupling factor (superfamily II helicase)
LAPDASVSATGKWFAEFVSTPAVQDLARRVAAGGALSCPGVAAPAQPFLAALLHRIFPTRPIVVVTENLKAQESVQQDIETWLQVAGCKLPVDARAETTCNLQPATCNPLFYPAWEILPHENKLPHADVISDRLETLVALGENSALRTSHSALIVTSVAALLQRTFAPAELRTRTRQLARGDRINPLDLVEWLEAQGYEPEAQVTQRGEIAMRGGIVDIFAPTSPWPVRLEFFGDELESLREFDPMTQVSREQITQITLPPAGELGILKREEHGVHAASTTGTQTALANPESPATAALKRPEGRAPLATLLDYLPKETIFLLCEPEQLQVHADSYAEQVPAGDAFFIAWPEFVSEIQSRRMVLVGLSEVSNSFPLTPALSLGEREKRSQRLGETETAFGAKHSQQSEGVQLLSPLLGGEGQGEGERNTILVALNFSTLDAFRPLPERPPEPQIAEVQRREFFNQLHRWLRQEYAVQFFCNNDGERQRFLEVWKELGFETPLTPQIGALARGFICEAAKLVVVTDAEIFGRYKVQRPRRLKSAHAQATRSALDIDFTDLEDGDLVVHLEYGIGRYRGLQLLPAGSGNRQSAIGNRQSDTECLVIEYAPADDDQEPPKLYVPVTEAHLVSKYVGAGKVNPPLNQLGGTRWAKAKEHAATAVRDVAAELLRIQAVRESQPGHAFPADVTWQREFESSFIYEETVDQMKAILETKADMERPKPMDRLICGDVGFGKTEVAIRAAFKAVMGGKQVAILVPTTVLAQQHYNNFRERMADYPVRVELLSRFRTKGEQTRVVKELATGAVDIIIGTHRLVQEDVAFKDLGLVVIDEEQRFGVLHKEKFKRLRTLVDVLTLSATPIPRTLYLALTGARDMSTIQTPPHDRLPVETVATEYDERLIRDAIQREMNRGGQVFFLHNRVTTILTMQQKLLKSSAACAHRRRAWPDARRRSGRSDDEVRQWRGGRVVVHDHHRERTRYSECEHHHH